MDKQCTWHPVLRWILFIPVGFVCTALFQGLARFAQFIGGSGAFWGNCLAAVAEPVAFLIPALWILPRFHRPFIVLFGVAYCGLEVCVLYMTFTRYGFSAAWRDIVLATVALASGVWAAVISFRNFGVKQNDEAQSGRQEDCPPGPHTT